MIPPTAESRRLTSWGSEGNLPDDRWPQAQAIVTEVIVDRPGSHRIVGTDQYGTTYDFGTEAYTVLGVSTGCHRNPPGSPPP